VVGVSFGPCVAWVRMVAVRDRHHSNRADLARRLVRVPPGHCHSLAHCHSLFKYIYMLDFFFFLFWLSNIDPPSIMRYTRFNEYHSNRTDLLFRLIPLPPSHCHSLSHCHLLRHCHYIQIIICFSNLLVFTTVSLNNAPTTLYHASK
jgi:hypothetical protein